jgi:hypothetical protein
MKYTPELVKQLIKYIEVGNYVKTACEAVGISEETFYSWIKDKPEFSESIKKAEAKALIRNLTIIQVAAKKNWQAAAWFLERKDYKNWGRKDQIGGLPDNPIKVDLSGLTIDELRKLAYEIDNTSKKGNIKTGKDRTGPA